MKKWLSLLACLLLVCTLTGCGNKSEDKKETSKNNNVVVDCKETEEGYEEEDAETNEEKSDEISEDISSETAPLENGEENANPLSAFGFSDPAPAPEVTNTTLVEGVDYIGVPPAETDETEENSYENVEMETDTPHESGETKGSNEAPKEIENTPEEESEFPSQMHKNDFTFYYDHVIVTTPDGEEEEAEIIAAPLSLEEGSKEIVVWTNLGDKSVVSVSGIKKTVLSHIGYSDLIVGGAIENGSFVPSVSLTKKETERNFKLEEETQLMDGKGGHIILADEDVVIHIFPTSFSNDQKGDAEFFYILKNGNETRMGDTSDEDSLTFVHDNEKLRIIARWDNETGTLYATALQI